MTRIAGYQALNRRYSRPKPLLLCYTCRYAEEFDLLSPLRIGFCCASRGNRQCVHAKRACKAYERLPGQAWT